MTIEINDDLLAEFARLNRCEHCTRRGPVDPHHIFSRGFGGGTRLDIRINLVAICRECHDSYHDRRDPTQTALLAIAAKREGIEPEQALALLYRLRRQTGGDYRAIAREVCPALVANTHRRNDHNVLASSNSIFGRGVIGLAIVQEQRRAL